jgi:uncharacterized protein YjbI with pentapeptide repeats
VSDLIEFDDGEAVGLRVTGARHAGAAFEKVRLVDAELVRCDLSGCDFREAKWHRVKVIDSRCTGIDLL